MTTHFRELILLFVFVCGCKHVQPAQLVDPEQPFQKSFEKVDRIEFVIGGTDRYGGSIHKVVTVDNWEEVRLFFEAMEFKPYEKGTILRCQCGGNELVRAYRDDVSIGEFTIHHGQLVRWSSIGTDLRLTPKSVGALEEYLNQQVYGRQSSAKTLEQQAPILPLSPRNIPANDHVDIDKMQNSWRTNRP
jgi:hypothetical protein